jgi:glyoxylase-like metal-dependent hydrolase (beta-lactamase superfamily II)
MTPEQVLDYPLPNPPAPGETREVLPGIKWLRMPLPFALDHINLWLLEQDDGLVIVDCGLATDATRALWQEILDRELRGRAVKRVIATHCHPDHAGLASWLTERFRVPLTMTQADYLSAHAWRDDAAGFTAKSLVEFYRVNGLDDERLSALAFRGNAYRKGVPDFPKRYARLTDGQTLALGGNAWRVVMGYGHSPEHAALYCDRLNVLISGDMVLPRISTNIAVQAVEPDGDPLQLFLDSLSRYAQLPVDTLVLPSHGLPFRGLRERILQLEEHHRLRLAELEEVCATPRAAGEVIATLFRRELDTHQLFFAMGEALAHLNRLVATGALARIDGADGVHRFVRR